MMDTEPDRPAAGGGHSTPPPAAAKPSEAEVVNDGSLAKEAEAAAAADVPAIDITPIQE